MAVHGERKKTKKKSANTASPMVEENNRWEVERDLDALCRAKAVKGDPKRMAECKKMATEKLAESRRKKDEAQAMIKMGMGD